VAENADIILPAETNSQVIEHYAPMVYRIALTKTKSTFDADDIFQEVFLRLAQAGPFDSEEHRKAWLIRVTINCCNSHFSAPWRKHITSLEDMEEAAVEMEERDFDLYRQVLALPQTMREVILLYYYEGMSIREIAETLHTSEVNIKKRLSRGRQKLKMELEQESEEHG